MEKNKLKTNKLGKVGKLIPALLAAGFLNCATLSANANKTIKASMPHIESTSLSNKKTSHKKAFNEYSSNRAKQTLKNITSSNLYNLSEYNRLEADVQNEVVSILTNMNANTLELSRLYKFMEDDTISNSGLTLDEINDIVVHKGSQTPDQVNVVVVRNQIQHFMHMFLDTQTLIRFRADEAEIMNLDEIDSENEYLRFNTKGERNLYQETKSVLVEAEKDILEGVRYENQFKGKNGEKIAKKVKANLEKIRTFLNKKDLSEKDNVALEKLINETADLLPTTVFGTQEMRRGLITEITCDEALNQMLINLEKLNYNLNTFKSENYKKINDFSFNATTTGIATNKNIGVNLGLGATKLLKNNWDLTIGTEINSVIGYNQEAPLLTQVLLASNIAKTTQNKKNTFNVGLKGGLQFDKLGVSTPFGGNVGYTWNINDKFSLDFGVNSIANIQRSNLNVGGTIGATYRTKNLIIKFGIGVGYIHEWNKNSTIPDKPIIDDEPIYGEDEVIKINDDDTTDEGSILDKEKKPIDLSKDF
ncbi:MAG: porin family protein [Clostridia bacterium]|nr:porin family protein [Clostridia bacterium]